MIIFNGIEYSTSYYGDIRYSAFSRFHDLEITSPHNIIDYTQMLLNGEIPEAQILTIEYDLGETRKHPMEIAKDDYDPMKMPYEILHNEFLKIMFSCNDINLAFLDVEECREMDVMTLKDLSQNVPTSFSLDEIKSFLKMSKYEKDAIINSGFTDGDLSLCYSALFKAKERFGEHIEYTNSLNEFLHKTFSQDDAHSSMRPVLEELISIYYQYPHIADILLHGDRRGASMIYGIIHPKLKGNELLHIEKWIFGEEHMKKLDEMEKRLSYLYEHHEDKDELLAYDLERNLFNLLDANIVPPVSPYFNLNGGTDVEIPEAIIVQNDFDSPTDDKKYILPNFNEFITGLPHDSYERIEIPTLDFSIECKKSYGYINPTKLDDIVEPIFEKIRNIAISSGCEVLIKSLDIKDIYKELQAKKVDVRITSELDILQETLQVLNQKIKFQNIPELRKINIIHHFGEQYMISQEQNLFHCSTIDNFTCSISPITGELDRIDNYHYFRNYSDEAMFVMSKEMIQQLGLLSVAELKKSIMTDEQLISAMKKEGFDGVEKVFHSKAIKQEPIVEAPMPYIDLINAFKQNYGRTPRIMPQISIALNNYFKGNVNECVESFNYKRISKIQGAKTPIMIKLSSVFDWNRVPSDLQQLLKYNVTPLNIDAICKYPDIITEFYNNSKNKDLLDFISVIDKISDDELLNLRKTIEALHNETNNIKRNQIRETIDAEVKNIITIVQQQRGLIDARQAEKEYNYSLINNSSSIMGDNICIMSGPYRAYFLNSLDSRHFSVGYDTSCCQHMGGAGEECVIAATSSPHCGTFVIESDGVIKAQAFVWESLNREGNKVLVLDNIEFANDRDTKDYIEILYGFCKECPYDTIHMGLSYNAVSDIGRQINSTEYVNQPITPYLGDEFYSDYDSVVALKTNGEMEFEVADAKYYMHTFETPTIMESSRHCINQKNDSLVAQCYDGICDIASKTTMVFSSDGTKKEPSCILPTYSFESTIPLKHNHMMKWNDIQPNDIAITLTHISEPDRNFGQYIIKPISFDGKEIATPNIQQRDSIYETITMLAKEHPDDLVVLKTNQGNVIIQTPNDFLQMCTESYISFETEDICCDELVKLETPNDNAKDFSMPFYDTWDYFDEGYYEENNEENEEQDEEQGEEYEEDEEYDEQQAFEDKWADWEDWGDRL